MSLKKLTNTVTVNGRISIGEKDSSRGFPKKLDYFRYTHEYNKQTKEAVLHTEMTKVMEEKYGKKHKCIEITLINDHPDEVFFTAFMNYPNNECNCKGDGQTATRKIAEGESEEVNCDYDSCQFRLLKTNKGIQNTCKPTGILTCIIPYAPISGGIWRFTTHSKMSIDKIMATLYNIFQIRGTLYGLKVNLKINIIQMKVEGKPQNIPTVEIEVPYSFDAIAEGAGTTIGTLMDARNRYKTLGIEKDPKVIGKLASEVSTVDDTEIKILDKPSVIEAEVVDNEEIIL